MRVLTPNFNAMQVASSKVIDGQVLTNTNFVYFVNIYPDTSCICIKRYR